jgi:cold shock CspA family protein
MSSTSVDTETTETKRIIGQVKWFNNKAGYGFITVSDGEYAGKDIFTHYSTIHVTNSQYKYLVQGEYVEFHIVKSTTDQHEFQATEVSGIKNGPLMCETRRLHHSPEDAPASNLQRRYRVYPEDASVRRRPVQDRSVQDRSVQDRSVQEVQDEFVTVRKRNRGPPPAARTEDSRKPKSVLSKLATTDSKFEQVTA